MAQQEPENKKNVVNLADARKRQKTVRAGASGRKGDEPRAKKGAVRSIWIYIQFILFLAVVAYMMQLCQRGGGA